MDIPERKNKKQSKVSFLVSIVLHVVLAVAIFLLAAREGILGKKMKEITAVVVPTEKKEPAKPKEEPKPEVAKVEPKTEAPKPTVAPPSAVTSAAPPPVSTAAAPPPAIGADFDFNDGAKAVQTTSDPQALYKQRVEYAFRSRWQKPDGIDDTGYVVEVEVAVSPDGSVTGTNWKRSSGDKKWDETVRDALASTKSVGSKLPKGFPDRFLVRFDAVADTEPVQ
jgi:outer membrane biosynthesis protein TonB